MQCSGITCPVSSMMVTFSLTPRGHKMWISSLFSWRRNTIKIKSAFNMKNENTDLLRRSFKSFATRACRNISEYLQSEASYKIFYLILTSWVVGSIVMFCLTPRGHWTWILSLFNCSKKTTRTNIAFNIVKEKTEIFLKSFNSAAVFFYKVRNKKRLRVNPHPNT